ncbi:uncharacterized protein PAC_16845 [Phialocephala subalpina]|uniref:Uncharacterized protein n=1 Tax=Phialocephala subalpina TaxID=576137 RepID=A0A1L7XPH1_9HELO|nr:uncharacterized protein PAC_16845 [Phialocephala subalpina]
MDPLIALSLAGTIVQFVDFGSKLISDCCQLYKSSHGTLDVNEQLGLTTADLQSVVSKLRGSSNLVPDEHHQEDAEVHTCQEDSFQQICDEAAQIAEELLNRLDRLKVKEGEYRRWKCLKAAVKSAWSKDEIVRLTRRLSIFKDSLNGRLLLSIRSVVWSCPSDRLIFQLKLTEEIRQNLDAEAVRSSARFDSLDAQTQRILMAILNLGGGMSDEILTSVTKLLCRFQALNQDEHHKTRQMIVDMRKNKWEEEKKTKDARIACSESDNAEANMANAFEGHCCQSRDQVYIADGTVEDIISEIEMLDIDHAEELKIRTSIQRKILEALAYPTMTTRYEDVLEAHPHTFDWIFCDPVAEQLPWSDFRKWLCKGQGVYWISGKAGSGKSTLMKHIYDDPRTRLYLDRWAQSTTPMNSPLCFASFFFWNSGTTVQKTQQGLLRALLFQVLGKHPDLVPVVFPETWAKLYSGTLTLGEQIAPQPLTIGQLTKAFGALVRQQEIPLKLFVLVDGLDEFEGNTQKLCKLFQDLSHANPTRSKFCLSSRPWVEFQECFGSCEMLRLQDLTLDDIKAYVADNLQDSQAFCRLETKNRGLIQKFVREIVEKADGVFLWVEIVVRLLLRGISNRDSISQLWKRLDLLPRELSSLFDALFSRIEPIYLEWASKAFQIMRLSRELSSDPFKKISNKTTALSEHENSDEGVRPLTVIGLFLALEEDLDYDEFKLMSVEDQNLECEDIQIHLTARCAGLLEVATAQTRGKICQESYVRYMHRSARDFIEKDAQWSKVLCYTDPAVFSPSFSMMKSCILSLTMEGYEFPVPLRDMQRNAPQSTASDALIYAHHADGHTATRYQQTKLLETLAPMGDLLGPLRMYRPISCFCFLEHAAEFSLTCYVEDTLSAKDQESRSKAAAALLDHLFQGSEPTSPKMPLVTAKMVNTLIMLGAVPRNLPPQSNEEWAPWSTVISWFPGLHKTPRRFIPRLLETLVAIIKVFLTAGADPTVKVQYCTKDGRLFQTITFDEIIKVHLKPNFPREADELLQAIENAIQRQDIRDEPSRKRRRLCGT